MTPQLNRDDLQRGVAIAGQISGLDLYPHLLGLLAMGQPVTLDRIAAGSPRQLAAVLRDHPARNGTSGTGWWHSAR